MLRLIIIVTICCGLVSAKKTGLTSEEKEDLLRQHNKYRSQDASQGSQSASNLRKMSWGTYLAESAQEHANKCISKHSDLSRNGIGENFVTFIGCVGFCFTSGMWIKILQDDKRQTRVYGCVCCGL